MKRSADRIAGSSEPDNSRGWVGGWWQGARRLDSPNFSARPAGMDISLAVVHSISLPPGVYGGDSIERFFTNQLDWDVHPYFEGIRGLQVSSHFLIRRCGLVVQFVSCLDRAWHAGASTWMGRDNCNDFAIGIEVEGLEGDVFEAAQYAALVNLLHAARAEYSLRHVVGHEHVAPGRKLDPGVGFDWLALSTELGWPVSMFAAINNATQHGAA